MGKKKVYNASDVAKILGEDKNTEEMQTTTSEKKIYNASDVARILGESKTTQTVNQSVAQPTVQQTAIAKNMLSPESRAIAKLTQTTANVTPQTAAYNNALTGKNYSYQQMHDNVVKKEYESIPEYDVLERQKQNTAAYNMALLNRSKASRILDPNGQINRVQPEEIQAAKEAAGIDYDKLYARKQALQKDYDEIKEREAWEDLKAMGYTEQDLYDYGHSYVTEEEKEQLRQQGKEEWEIAAYEKERSKKANDVINRINADLQKQGKSGKYYYAFLDDYKLAGDERFAKDNPIDASVGSLMINPLESTANVLEKGYDYATGKPLVYNQSITNTLREGASQNFDSQLGKTAYMGGMSIGDMAVSAMAATATGGGTVVSAGMQAIEKASQVLDEGVQRDLTPNQIIAEGIASGITTYLTEKIPMGKIDDIVEHGLTSYTSKEIGKTIAAQMLSEGLQEPSEDIADWIADLLITGDKNQFTTDIKNYIAEGMTKEQAVAKVIGDRFEELGTDSLFGALGGLAMGGASIGVGYTFNRAKDTPAVQTDNVMKSYESLNMLLEAGKNLDPQMASAEDAQQIEYVRELANKPIEALTEEDVIDIAIAVSEQANEENNLAQTINEINYQANIDANLRQYEETGKIEPKVDELPVEAAARQKAETYIKDYQAKSQEAIVEASDYFENEAAAKNFIENYNGQNLPGYTEASYLAYRAGESGQTFENFLKNSVVADFMVKEGGVSEAYLKNLYYNGLNARTTEENNFTLKNNENRGYATGLVEGDRLAEFKKKLAEKFNIEVFTDNFDSEMRGNFSAALAKLTVNATSDNEYAAIVHEMFEFARAYDPKGMENAEKALVNMIVNKTGESKFVNAVMQYRETYRKAGRSAEKGSSLAQEANKSFSEAQEEFINDAVSYIFSTDEGMKAFVDYIMSDNTTTQEEKVSTIQAIKDWVDKLISAIKNFISGNKTKNLGYNYAKDAGFNVEELESISRMLVGVLDNARENLAAKTEGKVTENAENSEKVSHTVKVVDVEKLKAEAAENIKTVASMKPVATLTQDVFKKGEKTLSEQVADFYESIGGAVENSILGTVDLNERGIRDSIAHGKMTRIRAMAFKSVPDVIKRGKIVNYEENWKGRNYDSAVILAPIKFEDFDGKIRDCLEAVVIIRKEGKNANQRFYLHSAAIIPEGAAPFSKTGVNSIGISGPGGVAPSINNILQTAYNYKIQNVAQQGANTTKNSLAVDSDGRKLTKGQQEYFKDSKIVDKVGRLKVMYHGTQRAGFTTFEIADDKISYFFTDNKSVAATYSGVNIFENPDKPLTLDQISESMWEINGTTDEDEVFKEANGKIEYWDMEGGKLTLKKTFDSLKDAQAWFVDKYITPLVYEDRANPSNYEVYLNATNPLVVDAKGSFWNELPVDNWKTHYGDVDITYTDGTYEVEYMDGKTYEWHHDTFDSKKALENKFGKIPELNGFSTAFLSDIYLDKKNQRVPTNTREYAEYAYNNGYDSVIFNNIVDNGAYVDNEIESQVVVVFNSNQVKSIYNENPTDNADIRFSLDVPVEVSDDLIAVHNMHEDELKKTLELGGFPMPSIAITKANMGHDMYGDISVLFNKDTIDPKKSKANKVYSGDAYTPEFPRVVKKIDRQRLLDLEEKLGLSGDYYDVFQNDYDDVVRRLLGNNQVKEKFLKDNDVEIEKKPYEKWYHPQTSKIAQLLKGKYFTLYNIAEDEELQQKLANAAYPGDKSFIVKLRNQYIDMLKHIADTDEQLSAFLNNNEEYDTETKKDRFYDLYYGLSTDISNIKNGYVETDFDRAAYREDVDNYIKDHEDEFKAFIDNAFKEANIYEGEFLRKPNVDTFLPSGKRRTFDQLHMPITLENIVKIMKSEPETGQGVLGYTFVGSANREFKSINDIKSQKDRLKLLNPEEYNKLVDDIKDEVNNVAKRLASRIGFDVISTAQDIAEAVAKNKTAEGVKRFLSEWYKVNDADIAEIMALAKRVEELPTGYFEAKPQRAVGLDEVAAVVVPSDDTEMIDLLNEKNIPVKTYERGDKQSRIDAVNSVENVSFSLDVQYNEAYKSNDTEKMDELVKEAARAAGFNSPMLYHGTMDFGFTQIDLDKMDDKMSFFATDNLSIASSYAGTNKARGINESNVVSSKNIVEALEELGRWKDIREFREGDEESRIEYLKEQFKRMYDFVHKNEKEMWNRKLMNDYIEFSNTLATQIMFNNIDDKQLNKLLKPLKDAHFVISDYAYAIHNALLLLRREGLSQNTYMLDGVPKTERSVRELYLPEEYQGIYKLYANTDNLLEIDGKGDNWNNIRVETEKKTYTPEELVEMMKERRNMFSDVSYDEESKLFSYNGVQRDKEFVERVLGVTDMHQSKYENLSTREIAQRANEQGYDGVIIRNITDDGGKSNSFKHYNEHGNIYIFFNPKAQVKSADTVTYDDEGNVIPLSERFNKENNDIRYSLDVKYLEDESGNKVKYDDIINKQQQYQLNLEYERFVKGSKKFEVSKDGCAIIPLSDLNSGSHYDNIVLVDAEGRIDRVYNLNLKDGDDVDVLYRIIEQREVGGEPYDRTRKDVEEHFGKESIRTFFRRRIRSDRKNVGSKQGSVRKENEKLDRRVSDGTGNQEGSNGSRPTVSHSIDVDAFMDAFEAVDKDVQLNENELHELIKNRMDLESDVSKKMISEVASNIKKLYNSSIDKKTLERDLTTVFRYLKNTARYSMDDVMTVMTDIAKPILENVKVASPEQEELYKNFTDFVKGYTIALNNEQMQEVRNEFGSYTNFKRMMAGKMKLDKNGTMLDDVWTEISDRSNGKLSFGTNPNDQPVELARYIMSLNPTYQNLQGQSLDAAATDLALEIFRQFYVQQSMTDAAVKVKDEMSRRSQAMKERYQGVYNAAVKQVEYEKALNMKRLAEEIDNLTAEEQEAIRNGDTVNQALIQNIKNEYQKRYDRLQAESVEKIAKAKADYQNAWINKNLRRERSELKNRLLREVKALQNIIAHPQEGATKHVPINLIKPTIEMLEAINLDNGGANKTIVERLKKMSEVYESFKNNEAYSFDYDERIAHNIEELQQMFENKSYADLSITELERVIEIVTALKTQIKNANNLILQGKLEDAKKAATDAMQDVRGSRRIDNAATNLLNRYGNIHLNAYREFRKLSGYKDGSLMDIYRDLDEGSKREMQIQKDLGEIFQDVLEGNENQKEVKKFISTKPQDLVDIGITDKNGKRILITRAMRMSLIMHSMNAGNMRHILGSGITVPNMYYFEKGKLDEAYAKGTNYRFVDYNELLQAIKKNDTNKINELTTAAQKRIEEMKKDLSPWEQKFLADAEEMFHEETGKIINDTSLKLKGYALARVKNYFPIRTDPHFTQKEWSGLVKDGSLEGSGFLKERVISTKPILLEDITNVVQRQIGSVAKYGGLAIPVRNFETIMKQTQRDQSTGKLENLSETIDSVWGASDTKWLRNLMQDIQGGRGEKNSPLMRLRGQFAGATLAMNPSVAMKQAASYPTAAAVVGWNPVMRAVKDIGKGFGGKGIAELEAINPLLWYRSQGYGTQELADAKAVGFGKNLPPKVQKAINWTQWFDTGTVRTLEYAAKYYVDDNFKNLEQGSEAYWEKVSEIFSKIVEETQPNYSTLHKADIIRNPNSFVKMLVMFKTQPMQNFGIIYDALGELNAAKVSGDPIWIDRAASKAANAISSQVVSASVFSAMTILSQLLLHRWWKYRDDEGKWDWKKLLVAFGEGIISCMTGAFIGGSELYEALKHIFTGETYYGIEVSTVEMVNDLVDNIGNLTKYSKTLTEANTSEDKEKSLQKILKAGINLGTSAGEFSGTPVGNIKNMLSAMYFYTMDAVRSIDEGELSISDDSKIENWEIPTQYERIYEAMQSGDDKKYQKLVDELVKDAMAGDENLTEEDAAAKVEEKVTQKILNMMKEGYLEGEISPEEMQNFLVEEKGKTEDEAYFQMRQWETGESTYGVLKDSINKAAEEPTPENRKAMIDEVNNLLAHGKDKGTIASQITSNYKAQYIELYNQGKAADLNAMLRAALVAAGYTDEEAKKKLSGWVK